MVGIVSDLVCLIKDNQCWNKAAFDMTEDDSPRKFASIDEFDEEKWFNYLREVVSPDGVSTTSHFWSMQFHMNAWLGAREVVRISGLLTPEMNGRRRPYGAGISAIV